jgi:hypothetical protein
VRLGHLQKVLCTYEIASRILVHPSTPRYLRLPGVFFLTRAWVLFTILTLQVVQLWPTESPYLTKTYLGRAISSLGSWVGDMEMDKACWQVFLAVCLGLVCAGLANGLERRYFRVLQGLEGR